MASIEARYIASYVLDAANEPQSGDSGLLAKTILGLLRLDRDVPAAQLATTLQTALVGVGVPTLD